MLVNFFFLLDLEYVANMFSNVCCSVKGKSMSSAVRDKEKVIVEPEVLMTKEVEWANWEQRERDIRQGIDLATTLERIEKNFVISDPRLPDCPIVSIVNSVYCNYV